MKGLTIKDAVYWVSQAWEDVSPITVKKSWKKLIPSSDADDNSSDAEEVASSDAFMDLFQELGYSTDNESWQPPQNWLAEDATDQLMTDSEIVAEVTGEKDSLDLESDDEMEPQPTVSPSQAFDAFETALKWLEGQSDTDPFHLLLVRMWRDTTAQKRVQTMKQTTLFSYLGQPAS